MKINKKNPAHWLYLILFGLNVACAIGLRPFRRRAGRPAHIVLYGHKLNGNLLAIYRHLAATNPPDMAVVFLTLDPAYHKHLAGQGVPSVLATTPQCAWLLSKTDAIITSHGLHAMQPLLRFSNIKFFDVWHGIPFKGFDADDFRVQHRYTETWVASPLLKKLYIERFGFPAHKVKVTGYARTDRLVRQDEDTAAIKRRLGLPQKGKIVLFAPTWKQDAKNRSVFPFGTDEQTFYNTLSDLAQRTDTTIVMRTHLNSGASSGAQTRWPGIIHLPSTDYPDTEAILLVSDILVCDWSSIAFDFLLLDRPTIFLDVEPPFAKGFSLGPEYRFGAIASGMDSLLRLVEKYLNNPAGYQAEFGRRGAEIKRKVYAETADGLAAHRCSARTRYCMDILHRDPS